MKKPQYVAFSYFILLHLALDITGLRKYYNCYKKVTEMLRINTTVLHRQGAK